MQVCKQNRVQGFSSTSNCQNEKFIIKVKSIFVEIPLTWDIKIVTGGHKLKARSDGLADENCSVWLSLKLDSLHESELCATVEAQTNKERKMAEIIASYGDGSGHYLISVDEGIMTTQISDHNGNIVESFEEKLTRSPELDKEADWDDWILTERFASNGDTMDVRIDGEAFTATFV